MATEKYNFMDNNGEHTFFDSLLFDVSGEKEEKAFDKMINADGFDSKDMNVELKINGIVVKIQNFNEYMDEWYQRVTKQIEAKVDLLEKEGAVEKRAEALLQEKCGDAMDVLYAIENSAHKIYDDE